MYICAVARRALALRFSLRPSYDVVRLLIFFGGRTNSGLLQVSGGSELRTVGHFISILCRVDLDQLFRLAILACLIFDQALRRRTSESRVRPEVFFGSAALLYVAFLPLLRAFQHEIRNGVDLHQRFLPVLANTLFSIYSLFVSESIAPWFWWLSIPATLSILACITFVVACAPKSARRFFLFGALLIGEMSIAGILNTRRLL